VQGNNVTASKLFSSFSVVTESTIFLYNIIVYCQNKRISYMSDMVSILSLCSSGPGFQSLVVGKLL